MHVSGVYMLKGNQLVGLEILLSHISPCRCDILGRTSGFNVAPKQTNHYWTGTLSEMVTVNGIVAPLSPQT